MPTTTFTQANLTADGYIVSGGGGASWASTLAGVNLSAVDSSSGNVEQPVGAGTFGPSFLLRRGFISFNTGGTIGGGVVSAAHLVAKQFTPASYPSPTHNAKIVAWTTSGASVPLSTTSWGQTGVDASSAFAESGVIPAGLTITLNAAGIAAIKTSGTAPTRFAIVSQDDYTNTQPTVPDGDNDVVSCKSGSLGWELVVTYTAVTPPTFVSIAPNNGPTPGGTAFTITGTGFVVGAAVTIGGIAASSVTVVNSTTITGTTGPHPAVGTVSVVITNSDGGSVTAAGAFTYTVVPPTLLSVSPPSGVTGGGTTVILSGSGFSSGGSPVNNVKFGLSLATSVVVVSDSQITCLSPAGTGTVNVSVTNPNSAGTSTLSSAFTYVSGPPVFSGQGSQLFYDFTRKDWFTGQYGPLQMICTDPTQGAPKIYALNYGNAGIGIGSSLFQIFNESVPGPQGNFNGQDRGFLQTMPLDFGNPKTQKKFSAVLLTVNDVTAVTASGLTQEPWVCFVYLDSLASAPIAVPLKVNPVPYNVFPGGAVEGPFVGELIGFFSSAYNGVLQGHTLYVNTYFPTGAPTNTPISGQDGGGDLHLPWSVYRIDVFASLIAESKGEV